MMYNFTRLSLVLKKNILNKICTHNALLCLCFTMGKWPLIANRWYELEHFK